MTRILRIVAVGVLASCSDLPEPTAVDIENAAELRGTTLDHLRSANWDCQQRGPAFISCAPPGIGLPPIPPLGEDGRPVYQLAVFGLDGTPVGTAHFVRADLYNGRTCAFTGQPFVFRGVIGYYECLEPAD
jgi:hypothetical protein